MSRALIAGRKELPLTLIGGPDWSQLIETSIIKESNKANKHFQTIIIVVMTSYIISCIFIYIC